MGTIANGKNTPLNVRTGTVPDVSGAMRDKFQPLVFSKIIKGCLGFQLVETKVSTPFRGNVQPLSPRQLQIKPEGQRAWSWYTVHSDPVLKLQVDDVGVFLGKQTRVMSRNDYSFYGYVEYSWVQDWQGPAIPIGSETPPVQTGVKSESFNWFHADGTTKTITHNLNSTDVDVTLIDTLSKEMIMINSIEVIDSATIILTASEAPQTIWRVTIWG